ncbi:hypothetical protein S7711_11376 [Stachybotrys chartarum IBT 7711]|uniref:Uncharacterized protein n=1 Tax=Stachybotrys chartarum (strain CBS 109288 / IBT 7711) TaxID=1280523 RepID=A0A084ALP2_STACB|nr:hypothetical protein S7711_11376 [Stachybotrys chartarum IBT 7711]
MLWPPSCQSHATVVRYSSLPSYQPVEKSRTPGVMVQPKIPSNPRYEPGSINHIFRANQGKRLYVRPLFWTQDHLTLLGCDFNDQGFLTEGQEQRANKKTKSMFDNMELPLRNKRRSISPDSGVVISGDSPTQTPSFCGENINFVKKFFLPDLLGRYGLHWYCKGGIPFWFNGKPVARVGAEKFYAKHKGPPELALIDMDTILDMRRASSKIDSFLDGPMRRIQRLKILKAMPEMEHRDPYIVGLMIGMAQQQRAHTEAKLEEQELGSAQVGAIYSKVTIFLAKFRSKVASKKEVNEVEEMPHTFKVRVIATPGRFTHGMDANFLYIYETDLTTTFLDKLERPNEYFACEPMHVSYWRIPISDLTGFTYRMNYMFYKD